MTSNINKIILLFSLICWVGELSAQTLMSLETAIQIALENNHQIKLKRIDTEISANNVNPALVGKKPVIDLNASYELGYNDASFTTLPIGEGQTDNSSSNLNGIANRIFITPEIRMLLFDGKASTFRLEQLGTINQLSQVALEQTIEQTLLEISNLYLEIARLTSQKDILQENLALTQNRFSRAVEDAKYGLSTSLRSLQIEVDLKTDSTSIRNIDLEIWRLKRNLNHLLGRDATVHFSVSTQFNQDAKLELATLENDLKSRNTGLQLQRKNTQIANYDFNISQSAFKPTISAYGNVNLSYLQDDANFLQTNRTIGPSIGVRLNYPIFDGGARKVKKQNKQLSIHKSLLEETRIQEALITELHNDFATYQNNIKELEVAQSNLPVFEKNLSHIQENYLMGLVTNTEVRAAQLNLNTLKNSINNYQFQLKQIELKLQFLTGGLLANVPSTK